MPNDSNIKAPHRIELEILIMTFTNDNTVPLSALSMKDVPHVGGKNASLGELIGALSSAGVRVPDGFATTSSAYRRFLRQGGAG